MKTKAFWFNIALIFANTTLRKMPYYSALLPMTGYSDVPGICIGIVAAADCLILYKFKGKDLNKTNLQIYLDIEEIFESRQYKLGTLILCYLGFLFSVIFGLYNVGNVGGCSATICLDDLYDVNFDNYYYIPNFDFTTTWSGSTFSTSSTSSTSTTGQATAGSTGTSTSGKIDVGKLASNFGLDSNALALTNGLMNMCLFTLMVWFYNGPVNAHQLSSEDVDISQRIYMPADFLTHQAVPKIFQMCYVLNMQPNLNIEALETNKAYSHLPWHLLKQLKEDELRALINDLINQKVAA